MGFREYKTAIEGLCYVVNTSTNPDKVALNRNILESLRTKIFNHKINKYTKLIDMIDDALKEDKSSCTDDICLSTVSISSALVIASMYILAFVHWLHPDLKH